MPNSATLLISCLFVSREVVEVDYLWEGNVVGGTLGGARCPENLAHIWASVSFNSK
jgi:hypothetical protein